MIIKINDEVVFTLSETREKVIQNDISVDIFAEDMCRRICEIIQHKYDRCFERLKSEWDVKLADNGELSVPTDKDAYAELVFSQSDYKDRKDRDLEAQE